MDNRILKKFYNYISMAQYNKQNTKLYFFLYSHALQYIYDYIDNEQVVNPNEREKILALYNAYQNETKSLPCGFNQIQSSDFSNFLEDYFKTRDWNILDNLYIGRDLLEIFLTFGLMDEMTYKRSNLNNNYYFINS